MRLFFGFALSTGAGVRAEMKRGRSAAIPRISRRSPGKQSFDDGRGIDVRRRAHSRSPEVTDSHQHLDRRLGASAFASCRSTPVGCFSEVGARGCDPVFSERKNRVLLPQISLLSCF